MALWRLFFLFLRVYGMKLIKTCHVTCPVTWDLKGQGVDICCLWLWNALQPSLELGPMPMSSVTLNYQEFSNPLGIIGKIISAMEIIIGHWCLLLGSILIRMRSKEAKVVIRTVSLLVTVLIIQIVLGINLLVELVNTHLWKGPETFLYETYSFVRDICQHGLGLCIA